MLWLIACVPLHVVSDELNVLGNIGIDPRIPVKRALFTFAGLSSLTPVVSTAQPPADHPRLGEGPVSAIMTGHHQGAPGVSLTRIPPRGPGTQHRPRDELTSVKLQHGN